MSDEKDIPVLTDMIEKGIEIKMSDLGLDESPDSGNAEPFIVNSETEIAASEAEAMDPFEDNPALEKTIRRILDEHTELAWQEIKLAIRRHLDKL
ncbi:MAG: hypothetical protein KJN95_06415 [Gammaproteobacteria bacterium]|nr:hypothetical protein [Gammaproteobacteria bacterium]MBT8437602.1 hypothetical protein [Gammaproteobacteria bacterium]